MVHAFIYLQSHLGPWTFLFSVVEWLADALGVQSMLWGTTDSSLNMSFNFFRPRFPHLDSRNCAGHGGSFEVIRTMGPA